MAENLGKLADSLFDQNQKIAAVNAQLKELEGDKRELENKLQGLMNESGTDIVRGKKATVSISETTRYQITDTELLFPFIGRKKAFHLFERRLSSAACKEMLESLGNKPIPGVQPIPIQRLNVRKAG